MASGRDAGLEADDDVLRMFFGGGQQQAQVNPMDLALQILGLGRQERQTAADLVLRREELAGRERLGGQEESGRQATRLHEQEMQRLAQAAAERDQKYREDVLGVEREKLGATKEKGEMDLLAEYARAHPELKLEDFQKMIAPYSPTMQGVLASTLEQTQKAKVKELGEAVRALYAKRAPMEQFKTLVGSYPEEVVGRAPWGEWAAGAPVSQTEQLTQGGGLLGAAWNAPGALINLGESGIEKALQLAVGKANAPELERIRYTNPFEKQWEGSAHYQGRPQAPPPEVRYGVAQGGPAPEWRYGTGTRPIPTESIPVETPVPPAQLFAPSVLGALGLPPVTFGMLLKKLGMASGAEAPFGTPPQEEEVPEWRYGVGRER
jgi:hypothetical protein